MLIRCSQVIDHVPASTTSITKELSSSQTTASSSSRSETSTPLTSHSVLPDDDFRLPIISAADAQRFEERRVQSDAAAKVIGNRLVRGWTLLAEECPGETCYGVPLMRPPFEGTAAGRGQKKRVDPRKVCVNCERTYVNEADASSLIGSTAAAPALTSASTSNAAVASGNGKKRALEAEADIPVKRPAQVQSIDRSTALGLMGQADARAQTVEVRCFLFIEIDRLRKVFAQIASLPASHAPATTSRTIVSEFDAATRALRSTLQKLSERLVTLEATETRSIIETAEAISKVAQAIKELQ